MSPASVAADLAFVACASRFTMFLSYLAAGMTVAEVLDDFPYLTPEDIQACFAFAAERERSMWSRSDEAAIRPELVAQLVGRLPDLFPGSSHVQLIGLDCADDDRVWEYARLNSSPS